MIHVAMALAQPGDVLVVDGKGDRSRALMGAIMGTTCKKLGLGGVVLDGAHRDSEDLLALGFPVYSVGSNPNGPTKNVPGRINGPISCGGVTVNPGDLVVGDGERRRRHRAGQGGIAPDAGGTQGVGGARAHRRDHVRQEHPSPMARWRAAGGWPAAG